MDKNYLVTKSNYFIMNCNYDLSLEEQKLILTLASMVQPNDEDFKEYEFRINDFMRLLGVDTKTKYTQIPKITKELMKKVFEIQEGNTLLQVAWLSSARYEKGAGTVILKFSPDLKPYMLQLKEKFTQYQLSNILSMKSKYSPRIYEILKCNQFKKQGYIEIEVSELRKLLKTDNIYSLYADFKRKVIIQVQKELKKNSDISFEFEEIKTGRKITSIRFFIHDNSKQKLNAPKEETPLDLLEKRIKDTQTILENRVKDSEALSICGSSDGDMNIIQRAYDYCKDKKTDNWVGYMIKIIKSMKDGTFNPPQKTGGKSNDLSKFNNFVGRNYEELYLELMEKCLSGLATDEEQKKFDEIRGIMKNE